MHKFEGIVIVVWKDGQPRSETVATLELNGFSDLFGTDVTRYDGEEGVATKLNPDEVQEYIDVADELDLRWTTTPTSDGWASLL